ncbi:GntR family transcriptional regulator [Ancylobacter sp. Lp-2]|uniref:GntR family transcriptional regulator n=1 Tax=Ancylobacter sp. Lp-2 TaxID=2881339 RepID=UPI001E3C436B|nr:GntR family transcriptional regulator [Ancylobacter sp. Lp-2]MCB4771575.1 GntR family transcriptional regulator [Ancylobacter sp. Lp-2]
MAVKPQSILEKVVATSSVVDLVVDRLEAAIMTGELASGERLSEQAIANSMGISRGPLREALRRLEGRGLIERIPNMGARVTPLLRQSLEAILVIRESLETLACRLAAERITPAELKALEGILKKKGSRNRDDRVYHQSPDQDFHLAIIMACGNEKLISILRDDIYYMMRFHRYRSGGRPGRSSAVLDEHRAIFEALKEHMPEKAEVAMREHLVNAHKSIRSSLSD